MHADMDDLVSLAAILILISYDIGLASIYISFSQFFFNRIYAIGFRDKYFTAIKAEARTEIKTEVLRFISDKDNSLQDLIFIHSTRRI